VAKNEKKLKHYPNPHLRNSANQPKARAHSAGVAQFTTPMEVVSRSTWQYAQLH